MKIHPMGAKLFHADERKDTLTDMTKLIVALRSFTKAPKSGKTAGALIMAGMCDVVLVQY